MPFKKNNSLGKINGLTLLDSCLYLYAMYVLLDVIYSLSILIFNNQELSYPSCEQTFLTFE